MAQKVEIEGLSIVDGKVQFQLDGGKYDAAAKRGRLFHQTTTPLGLAIPIYTTVTPLGNVLWNPQGSGVRVKLVSYGAVYVSGTAAYGSIVLMAQDGFGSDLATGSKITAFADTDPDNALFGGGEVSKIRSSNAGTVTITAFGTGDAVRVLTSINLEAITATAHGNASEPMHDFDGQLSLMPGTLAFVGCRVASVALYAQTLVWEEELL